MPATSEEIIKSRITLPPIKVVSFDDPAAVEKLEARLASMEREYMRMKMANRYLRSGDHDAMRQEGWSNPEIKELSKPYLKGRMGFPPSQIRNALEAIRRVRGRIRALENREVRA